MGLFSSSKKPASKPAVTTSTPSYPDKITVIATTRAKAGHEDEVRKGFAALVVPSRQEPGCLHYEILEDAHYTGRFSTLEIWISEDALTAHLLRNRAAINKVKAFLAEDLRISVLKPVS